MVVALEIPGMIDLESCNRKGLGSRIGEGQALAMTMQQGLWSAVQALKCAHDEWWFDGSCPDMNNLCLVTRSRTRFQIPGQFRDTRGGRTPSALTPTPTSQVPLQLHPLREGASVAAPHSSLSRAWGR